MPPPVDEVGDINLHGRQTLELVVEFFDNADAPRDMRFTTVTFEVGPTFDSTLLNVTGELHQKKLVLSNDDIVAIANAANKDFVVIDHSAGNATPVWEGRIYMNGWVE